MGPKIIEVMETHFEILIDASGSMGLMEGDKDQTQYLLPDGKSTRTDLVKAILITNIIPNLSFADSIRLSIFRTDLQKNVDGTFKTNEQNHLIKKEDIFEEIYIGGPENPALVTNIKDLRNPEKGGTPLYTALINKLSGQVNSNINIIVLSDGSASDNADFDKNCLTFINQNVKLTTIHFIGIAQNIEASKKSRNLAEKTGGIYTNLKAMNYDKDALDILLSKLNTTIISKALDENIKETQVIASSKTIEKAKIENIEANVENEQDAAKEKENLPENDITVLEKQVQKNTTSLEFISSQLNNILSLLQSKEQIEEDVKVVENKIHNERIGRLAEEFLYKKLQELFKSGETKVTWLNELGEKGLSYDFLLEKENDTFYYECKGTATDLNEFQLTKNEWDFYMDNREKYRLCFVKNVDAAPQYVRFMDLLKAMEERKLVPCAIQNRAYKANRIVFTINNSEITWT